MVGPDCGVSKTKPQIILDCDPGLDDAMAIAVAARHTDLLGITTVAGNVSLQLTTANALTVCEVFDVNVPVHSGAAQPLTGPTVDAAEIHGESGLNGPDHPEHSRSIDGDNAVEFMVETLRANPGAWLVPIGPMTNIAQVIKADPGVLDSVAGISFMGGARTVGNATATAEFNIWGDPEAAAIVIGCGHPNIRMSGLQLTSQFQVHDGFLGRVKAIDTDAARWTHALLDFLLDAVAGLEGFRTSSMHDPVAVLSVTHPELVQAEPRRVDVELAGVHTRGMTVVDQRSRAPEAPNVQVGMTINGGAMADLLLGCLAPEDAS